MMITATAAPTRVCRQVWKLRTRLTIGTCPTFGEVYRRAEVVPLPAAAPKSFEVIDAEELAKRLDLPKSWVVRQTRPQVKAADRIPHLRFGRYVKFQWLSAELAAWIEKRKG